MLKQLLVWVVGLALVVFPVQWASGQQSAVEIAPGKEEVRRLGKNLAINLVLESADTSEGFTILTATENFLVQTELEKGKEQVQLRFEGDIEVRDSRMVIGERRIVSGKQILVHYKIKMNALSGLEEGGFVFSLKGSVLLDEDEQVTIARSKDMVLKLKIGSL